MCGNLATGYWLQATSSAQDDRFYVELVVLELLGVDAGVEADSAGFDSADGLDSVEGLVSLAVSEADLSDELALLLEA